MLIIITILVAVLLFIVFYLVSIPKTADTQVRQRVRSLSTPAPAAASDRIGENNNFTSIPLVKRLTEPLTNWLSEVLANITPSRFYDIAEQKIMQAGKYRQWNVKGLISLWAIIIFGMAVLAVLYAVNLRMAFIQGLMWVVCAGAVGAIMPVLLVNSRIARRRKAIMRQLPDVMDLLCVSVQAGLSFDGAVGKLTEKMHGELINEFQKMLQDIRMGMTRRQSLTNMADRCGIQELSLFTAAVIQSDKLGVGIANTLLLQAENMRERHRQYVKAQALKAPVKIIFPLMIFIFPTLFIVVMVPPAMSLMKNFLK